MAEFILVADTHLGHKSTIESFDLTLRLFEEICGTANERRIDYLVHLGDFYDKKSISFKMLEYLNSIKELLGTTFIHSWLIVGNHDVVYKNKITPNGLSYFYHSSTISVIEEPTKISNKISLFPWITTNNINQIKEMKTEYLLGHFPVNGIPMNKHGTVNENLPLNTSDLKQYKVLSGHFHECSTYDSIRYLGSPQHFDFSDSGERGFYIFDDKTESLEFIPFSAPKFIVIDANQDYSQEIIKDNNIRIDFLEQWSATEIEKRIKQIEDLGALSIKSRFTFTSVIEAEESSPIEISRNKEIMDNYLDNIEYPKGISDKLLKSIINNLYEECKGE